ncbi:DEAD/DEAH box helicase [Flavobacterium agricola]|uniref:DEAD/DEAH box helicase n=1 Tax=Flavobacterium agricola TaxID=2870839 RepID=A0ABY6M040_9FLAO|nr:DEAD/DEAH box helicase [Flavobacterium agricola]UYW01886.1 DEAD/DEAH box helicase [Flavobacterium agricola]
MKLDQVLSKLNIKQLNAMQQEALQAAKTETNVILLSPTGSGKTLAFLLPILSKLKVNVPGVQAVILVPSRELALQIEQVFKKLTTEFKINACYGGHNTRTEINNLSSPPAVLVGTPGRVAFHIREASFNTQNVTSYVVDEFDKALEMGFQQDMDFIINTFLNINFRMLTSATALKNIPEFTGMQQPKMLTFLKNSDAKPDLTFKKVYTKPEEKLETVIQLLGKLGKETVLIFCNHRDAVDRISETLHTKGVANTCFHGGLTQDDRERALLRFRNKSSRILITTDLAARGLDIPEIGCVIHYQIPDKEETFIHRNGRTARMKAKGTVYALLMQDENVAFIDSRFATETLTGNYIIDNKTDFKTLYISAGKKDKVNKVDIVGFLIKIGGLAKEDIGLIEVKDTQAFVAVVSKKIKPLLAALKDKKLKNKKVKIEIAQQ